MAEANSKRVSIKSVSKEKLATGIYEATYTGGQVVTFDFGALYPGFADLPEVPKNGIIYGWKQKLDDSIAGAADEAEAVEEQESTVEALKAGKWTTRTPGEGGEAGGLFARALAKARNISLADAKAKLADAVKKNQSATPDASERSIVNAIRTTVLSADPAVAQAYADLQKERAQKLASKIKPDVGGL